MIILIGLSLIFLGVIISYIDEALQDKALKRYKYTIDYTDNSTLPKDKIEVLSMISNKPMLIMDRNKLQFITGENLNTYGYKPRNDYGYTNKHIIVEANGKYYIENINRDIFKEVRLQNTYNLCVAYLKRDEYKFERRKKIIDGII